MRSRQLLLSNSEHQAMHIGRNPHIRSRTPGRGMSKIRFVAASFLLLIRSTGAERRAHEIDRKHFHLAVGPDPATSMTVSFSSFHICQADPDVSGASCPQERPPVGSVLIGKHPKHLSRLVREQAPATQYTADYLSNGTYTSPLFHHILVDGLEPDTRYYYYCVSVIDESGQDDDEENEALRQRRRTPDKTVEILTFKTAPPAGANFEDPITLAIVGDLGKNSRTLQTLKHMKANKDNIDAVILAGDIAYARLMHHIWDEFFTMLDDVGIAAQIPIQVAPGNHDIDRHPATGDIFVSYDHRFRMPQVHPATKSPDTKMVDYFMDHEIPYPVDYEFGNAYYAFTYGPSRNIILSSYSSTDEGSEQRIWLEGELQSIDRTITPWVTVTMHLPFYNTYIDHRYEPQASITKENLETLFIEHQVNVVFSGHVHAYQRTFPIVYDEVDPAGPVYIIMGEGGRAAAKFHAEEPEEWVAARDVTSIGYGTIKFLNQTHAYWEWCHSGRHKGNNNYVYGNDDIVLPEVHYETVYLENQFYR